MTRPAVVLAAALLCVSCATAHASQPDQISALRADMAVHDAALLDAQERAQRLRLAWREVADAYDRASMRYAQTRAAFEEARGQASASAEAFARAQTEFEAATEIWKFYGELVRVAAAIDAANLDAARAGRFNGEGPDCRPMSAQQYRRQLEQQGVDLTGKDIDHIVPRSLGGADDVSNYQVLDQSLNRSLGATWGPDKCNLAGIPQCALAVAISHRCGAFTAPMPW